LTSASQAVGDVADRHRAELLASLLLAVIALGVVSIAVQLVIVPGFAPIAAAVGAAMAVLGLAYGLARTPRWRIGAFLAALVPMLACAGVGVMNPEDRGWPAFMVLGVVFATTFLELGGAVLVVALALAATALVIAAAPVLQRTAFVAPSVGFQLVISALLLVVRRHRDQVEPGSERPRRGASRPGWRSRGTSRRLAGWPARSRTTSTTCSRWSWETQNGSSAARIRPDRGSWPRRSGRPRTAPPTSPDSSSSSRAGAAPRPWPST
jgi:hypothetical protein